MRREAVELRGWLGSLADQTTVVWEILRYQIEKVKRFGEVGSGWKPAAKRELGERSCLFWVGVHVESEEENEKRFWENEGGGKFERRKKKRKKRDMVWIWLWM